MEDLYPSRRADTASMTPIQDPVLHRPWSPQAPLTAGQAASFERNGFLVLDGLFTEEEVALLQQEAKRLRSEPQALDPETLITEPGSDEVRSIFAVHQQDPVLRRLAADQRLAAIAEFLLDDQVYIHQSRLNYKPGFRGKEFYWHSDFETWHVEDGMPRMRAVSISVLLTDNEAINGALMLIPGSHKTYVSCVGETPQDHYRQSLKKQEYGVPDDASLQALVDRHGIAVAAGKPGTVLVFHCNVMHGSNGNITPQPRSNVFFVYNAVSNALQAPFGPQKPRPWFLGTREPEPILPQVGLLTEGFLPFPGGPPIVVREPKRHHQEQEPPMTEKIDLFTPIVLGPYTLPNRIAMAPMTRNRASAEGVPTGMMARYYAQRASAGILISEGVIISPEGIAYPNTPGLFTPAQIQGWKAVTEAVHERGGRIFAQLWHCGRVAHPEVNGGLQPIGPSAIAARGETYTPSGSKPFVTPHAMSLQEIEEAVERYAQAARNAKTAGFDGVEIHGANGYLIDQFLRDGSNRRTDAYGGSIANRARFLMEVTEAVLGVWDRGCVGVRLSPLQPFNDMRDSNPEATFSYVVKTLGEFKLGYLHLTEMGKEAPGVAGPAFDLKLLRPLWPTVYMTNGGYTFETANAAIARGEADMISFGQLFIANPDLVERFRRGAPLNTPDPSTFYTGGEKGYLDYPTLHP